MIKAIIFDCFGVVYPQVSGAFYERHKERFKSNPQAMVELNLKIDLGKISRAEFFEGLESVTGIPASVIRAEIDNVHKPDARLVDYIEVLKKDYKIGLLSNAGEEEIECVYRDELNSIFDAITVSYEIGYVKPSPEIFHECTKRLEVAPEQCLFIDDSATNINAAEELGMQTILYKNFQDFKKQLEKMF